MRPIFAVLGILLLAACEKPLSPTEQAAKDRSECIVVAIDQSGFDPTTAEAPPRTVSSSHKRGGTFEEGAVDVGKGVAGGAVAGVVGGAIMGDAGRGAAAGAAVGGLIGGVNHYKKRQETVTTTRPNPEYEAYEANKAAYKSALEQCLAARAEAPK
jgi:hypothetical protein